MKSGVSQSRRRAIGRLRTNLRIVYSDLRRRNTQVRIFQAPRSEGESSVGAFIVSPYRSGTTLLRFVLDSHSRVAVPPESDFLHLLEPVTSDLEAVLGLASMGFDSAHVKARVARFVAYFFESYAASLKKDRWVDKSPAYVEHHRFIRELFPDARFIALHRHPLDVAESFTRGGAVLHPALAGHHIAGEDYRVAACRYWADRTQHMLELRDETLTHWVAYDRLCERPEEIIQRVLDFLDLPWEDGVLRFNETTHDLGKESVRIRGTRGFEPSFETFAAWPESLREECWKEVAVVASSLGYSPNNSRTTGMQS